MQQTKQDNPDHINGRDLPNGDGGVGDEQVNAIGNKRTGKETGQDHSTDIISDRRPTEGVGGVQHSDDTTTGDARGI